MKRYLSELLPLSQMVFVLGKLFFVMFFSLTQKKDNFFTAESGSGKSTLVGKIITCLAPGIFFLETKIC